jgi:translation initiation factor 5B
MVIRSPIVCVLGHVDHGKTTILDSIRGSNVAAKEVGAITQMIGASYVTKETLERLSKCIASKMPLQLRIPGLLFIDTPGHEAFTNLRDRGGSIADIAILVVDIMQGFQPQTIESIRILKQYKTPFVIAANKIDMMQGWKNYKTESFLDSLSRQPEHIKSRIDERIYELIGKISEYGFDSERFDRISDFKKQIAVVPVSARTREGLAELLVLIAGLSQRFLEEELGAGEGGRGKASIIEVKEERGMGTTLDIILYEGVLQRNSEVMFLTQNGVMTTKIRGLLLSNLGSREKFLTVETVNAAAGVKIIAPNLEKALPGSPLEVVINLEEDKLAIEAQFKNVLFESNEEGIIVKADSLGSVEAIIRLLSGSGIKVKSAGVGKITRKDIVEARAGAEKNRYYGVVLGFNVQVTEDARVESRANNIPIIWSNIIYHLLEQYNEWVLEEKEKEKNAALEKFPWPGKIKVLDGYCFRVSKPAIFGVQVLCGRVKTQYRLMNAAGEIVGEVREIQHEKEKVDEAKAPQQLAVSCDGIVYGKNTNPNEVLYVYMTSEEMEKWEKQVGFLSEEEKSLFEEMKRMRKRYF